MATASSSSTSFGLDMLQAITASNPDNNAFISPFSMYVALSMTQLGAAGETSQVMMRTLRWAEGREDDVHNDNHQYIATLNSDNDAYALSVANRLYVEKGYSLVPTFLEQTEKLYSAGAVAAHFSTNAEEERTNINTWVSDKTQEKIKDLLAPGILNSLTRMVLVNAIYFKGTWKDTFKANDTQPLPFKITKTQTKQVPTMIAKRPYCFYLDNGTLGFSALELPYKGNDLSMVILLPNDDFGLAAVEKSLSAEKLTELFSKFKYSEKVNLRLPKFEMTHSYSLKPLLSQLGMSIAFDHNKADFSKMSAKNDLVLSEVVHKAFVKVDEAGTEAAAATAAIMMLRCALPVDTPPDFFVDHPFLFIIRDKRVPNSVLFIGRVVDPTA